MSQKHDLSIHSNAVNIFTMLNITICLYSPALEKYLIMQHSGLTAD